MANSERKRFTYANSRRFRGVRLEDPGFRNPIALAAISLTEAASHIWGIEVEGSLPRDGSALLVLNHSYWRDGVVAEYLGIRAGRTIRVVARDTLINPNLKDEPEVLERIAEKKDEETDDEKNPGLGKRIGRRVFAKAFVMAGNPVPVHRGKPSREFLEKIDEILESGQMLGVFLQETRTPQNDLSNAMPGAGYLAKKFPDLPVYVATITNSKIGLGKLSVKIEDPFTFNSLSPDGRMKIKDITRHIAGLMGTQLRRTEPNVKLPPVE